MQESLHSPSDIGPAPSTASSAIGPEISVVSDNQVDGKVATAKTNGAVAGGASPPKKRNSLYKVMLNVIVISVTTCQCRNIIFKRYLECVHLKSMVK